MFIMFLDCASLVLVAPPLSVIKLWLENHVFTFSTSSLKHPAGGALYYARRLPKPSFMCCNVSDWKAHGSEYYECSRYKENPNIANESAHAQAREALKKYLFYFERVTLFYL